MKVVVNTTFGGFRIPRECKNLIKKMYGITEFPSNEFKFWETFKRTNPYLVEWVENNESDLAVVEIPDGVDFIIEDYDGKEWVSEVHRTWYPKAKEILA